MSENHEHENDESLEFRNPIKCEVCGALNYEDDYGNTDKCPNCGWEACSSNELEEIWHGISYPMLVPLSRAREQYKAGQKFKATFEDFINGLKFYAEMLFWYNGKHYEVYETETGALIYNKDYEREYQTIEDFRDHAEVEGKLLKDIWDDVVHPCFMYCVAEESDYDVPPED